MQCLLVNPPPCSLLTINPPYLGLWTQFMCLYFVLTRTVLFFRTQFMFQYSWFLLLLLAWVGRPKITYLLGYLVSCRAPVSVEACYLCLFLLALPVVFILLSREFLAHESYPSSWLFFILFQVCQLFLATDFHVFPRSGIRPDMQVHSFLEFSCHPFYLSFTF